MNSSGLLGLAYRLPGVLTLSARLTPKKVVIQEIEPPEVEAIHNDAISTFERAASAHLCTFGSKGLPIVGPPLEMRKREILNAIALAKPKFEDLIQAVIKAWPQIADAIRDFNAEYADFIRRPRSPELDSDWIRERFTPKFTWVPIMLSKEIESLLFSPEEQAHLREELAEAAKEAYAAKAEGLLKEMVSTLQTAAAALQEGRPVDRRTIRRLSETYGELGQYALQTDQGKTHAAEIEAFGNLLETLSTEREALPKKKKDRNLGGLSFAVARATAALDPLLDAWDSVAEDDGVPQGGALDQLVEALAS